MIQDPAISDSDRVKGELGRERWDSHLRRCGSATG